MPIYEYQCCECGKKYEVLQSWREADEERCRFCNGKVKRLISPAAFHLKGSGWYVTDYADNRKKTASHSKAAENKSSDPEKDASSTSNSEAISQKHNDAA